MLRAMSIRFVVLDFDGTCTLVERVEKAFLDEYLTILAAANALQRDALAPLWKAAIDDVRAAAPEAGWTLLDVPSTAPAAADPYILSGEAALLLKRRGTISAIPGDAFKQAYGRHEAPFRPELEDVLEALVDKGLQVGFISNSERTVIAARLEKHLGGKLMEKIHVTGGAAKFKVAELPVGWAGDGAASRDRFEALPGAATGQGLRRPIYLRRGWYFDAMCTFWKSFGAGYSMTETLVVGDVWELDLAMPQALGATVHLIKRAEPYRPYAYELAAAPTASEDLTYLQGSPAT